MRKKKLLYLHGYQGFTTKEKKDFLDTIAHAQYPLIDYDAEAKTVIKDLLNLIEKEKIEILSGTSLGAILAYLLSRIKQLPCLLLNPGVTRYEEVKSFVPKEFELKESLAPTYIVAGKLDTVISYDEQLKFYEQLSGNNVYEKYLLTDENLEHRVSLEEFQRYFTLFFQWLNEIEQ
ncbi:MULTISPECIES: YqiA/YcfP family alpha/beta fold hydrolase [Weeksella]|uniref:Esterase n=1 Tax=Weeksella virosa (strain ATCC 43766 / DSM 16922 / JCM 21250 / CCUG 30538 / CDC 9751 / IAM 14551 / NBRC 16016 / NCTC 11634 / CL345/78) TaxID=865938 RepID=F0NZV7_WEEVC|nr:MULTISPECIES: YqiA/YcfP family alpha/beta fold hydrolase [Weeksella]ADX68381.1 hypothetical protein Weevi_1688 [Weeksella virosa DSM 16922]MDK7674657.1 YqiA/YcfP family alpha/beta fold hydrolase [Weeksella virosa]OFM83166.1 hypothetical protein HMPREF2660_02470 [Weeksella sp. HMSC059D05]VEH63967.1 esterase YqiA [Weeksella virosa]